MTSSFPPHPEQEVPLGDAGIAADLRRTLAVVLSSPLKAFPAGASPRPESEWLTSTKIRPMLDYHGLWPSGRNRSRKLRLFAVACCRRVWHLLPNEVSRHAVVIAERYADKLVKTAELKVAFAEAGGETGGEALRKGCNPAGPVARMNPPIVAFWASLNAHSLAGHYDDFGTRLERYQSDRSDLEQQAQTDLSRDVFGNPFRPVSIESIWLTTTVTSLALAAYEERIMPSGELDPARLAVLSDALEDAGCDNAEILEHLRSPGPHVRGCWVVDLMLGKK